MKYQRLFKLYKCHVFYDRTSDRAVLEMTIDEFSRVNYAISIDEQLLKKIHYSKNELTEDEYLKEIMLAEVYKKVKREEAREFMKSLPRKERKLIMKYL